MAHKLRLAVIGAGSIARRFHLPSLASLALKYPLELAALCDLNRPTAEALAAQFGFARAYDSVESMLASEQLSAVWLLVPTSAMPDLAQRCLERGLPILLEKPPAENAARAGALAQVAAQTGTHNQVAFNRRFAPLMQQARQLANEHQAPHFISCQFYRVRRTEAIFPYSTGLHGLDAVRYLSGSEVREVRCQSLAHNARLVAMNFESGCEAVVELIPNSGIQSERYTLHSGERTIVVDGVIPWLTHFPGFLHHYEAGQLVASVASPPSPDWEVGGFRGQSEAFVVSLLAGRRPAPDLAEALRSVQVAEAAQHGATVVFGGL